MLYVIIVLVLASFVIAFFSAKTWHWGYVVVVELILLSTFGFLILAAEALRINKALRTQVNTNQKQLDTVLVQNDVLKNGSQVASDIAQLGSEETPVKMPENAESIPSIEDLDHDLLLITRQRGRVWRNAKPAGPANPQTGAVTVAVTSPLPGGKEPKPRVVFVFDDGPPQPPAANGPQRGPQYLGEFTAVQTTATQSTLTPVLPMDEFERRRLAASRGPWIIYESMPMDRHDIFEKMPEQELVKRIPKQSMKEYVRDGKEATKDDDPLRVAGYDENNNRLPPGDVTKATKKLYQRRLRDYASEFDELARRRIVMLGDIDALNKDIERLKAAQDVAKQLQAFREGEKQKLTTDLAGVTKERDAIERHLNLVKQQLARARELTDQLLRENNQKAAELAARQLRPRPNPNGATSPAKTNPSLALGGVK